MTRPTAPLLRPLLTLSGLLCLAACGDPAPSPTAPKPAKAESVAHESELLKLTLAPEAVRRLGIATEKVGAGSAARVRATGGEIVVPSFGAGGNLFLAQRLVPCLVQCPAQHRFVVAGALHVRKRSGCGLAGVVPPVERGDQHAASQCVHTTSPIGPSRIGTLRAHGRSGRRGRPRSGRWAGRRVRSMGG